jgi:hypothetical protein
MAYSKAKLKGSGNKAYYSHKKNSHCCEKKSKQLTETNVMEQLLKQTQ